MIRNNEVVVRARSQRQLIHNFILKWLPWWETQSFLWGLPSRCNCHTSVLLLARLIFWSHPWEYTSSSSCLRTRRGSRSAVSLLTYSRVGREHVIVSRAISLARNKSAGMFQNRHGVGGDAAPCQASFTWSLVTVWLLCPAGPQWLVINNRA